MAMRWDNLTEILKKHADFTRSADRIEVPLRLSIVATRSKNNPIVTDALYLTINGIYYKTIKSKKELLEILRKA